jgi:lipopolysaccharide transport system ATP-binding protein
MSDDAIIRVEGLGKRYRLDVSRTNVRYTALRDVIANSVSSSFRRLRNGKRSKIEEGRSGVRTEEFWALRDVSFEVRQGEVLGIIGRNGAGKSTLLKILSRITDPTEGRVRIRGRVASLLEVGTGFHPELTGRENFFLNGAILGMSRAEIKAKFDEIVAFAEVEKFLDTPVKRYSSGMYVRLAFAVAAHLEPEILIVDEVLAVGDAEFQKKCLGKMKEVATGHGRTVLFVSHNMAAVGQLCTHGMLLTGGHAQYFRSVRDCIGEYLSSRDKRGGVALRRFRHLRAVEVQVPSAASSDARSIDFGDPLGITVALTALPTNAPVGVNIGIRDDAGVLLSLFSTNPHDGVELPRVSDLKVGFALDSCCFAPGRFTVDVAVTEPGFRVIEEAEGAAVFDVQPRAIGGHWPYDSRFGSFFPKHGWTIGA